MMRLFRNVTLSLSKGERGSAAVEFAIVTPLLIYMLIGLVDIGRYMYYGIVAEHAARAAVQYGSQTVYTALDPAGVISVAKQDGQGLSLTVPPPTIQCVMGGVTVTCPSPSSAVPTTLSYYIQVQVTGTFHPLVAYPGIPSSVPVTATAMTRLGSQ